jgi:hypothetical protein
MRLASKGRRSPPPDPCLIAKDPEESLLPVGRSINLDERRGRSQVRSKREVRYVVSRLRNPDDIESAREAIGCHPSLDLAKKHADRLGPGTCVDAEGGTYHSYGQSCRCVQWQMEWINRNLYQGGKKKSPVPGV